MDEPWCGEGERWEGEFLVQVRKNNKVLSSSSLNSHMKKHKELSFWAPEFSLVFEDYNGDGEIDFNLGQYGGCDGNDFWLFTVRRNGKIEPLPIDDEVDWLFIQNPMHNNSTVEIEIEDGLLKHTFCDRDADIKYVSWYQWTGKKYVIARKQKLSFEKSYKDQ